MKIPYHSHNGLLGKVLPKAVNDAVTRLKELAESLGYKIDMQSQLLEEEGIAFGRIYPKERILLVLPNLPAEVQLVVLAHELGHHYTYVRLNLKSDESKEWPDNAEGLAYLYGWGVLVQTGLKGLVSKRLWRDYHKGATTWEVAKDSSVPTELWRTITIRAINTEISRRYAVGILNKAQQPLDWATEINNMGIAIKRSVMNATTNIAITDAAKGFLSGFGSGYTRI